MTEQQGRRPGRRRPPSEARRRTRARAEAPGIRAEEEALEALQSRLGLVFADRRLLREALTHSSYSNERGPDRYPSNERLEFLGDGVVNLAVAWKLWDALPREPEGVLTRMRAHLVQEKTLADWALRLGLDRCVFLGVGEEQSGGRRRPALLADAFEAVVGAMFLAFGWETARDFVGCLAAEELEAADGAGEPLGVDPKTRLQEWLQRRRRPLPVYRLVQREGPPHRRRFTVSVEWDGRSWGTGRGKTLKEAEAEAARRALRRLEPPPEPF